ncbi:glycosyltransferase family 2 protein [Terrimonas sp. NA20]|uniref:Glycosyltransferase family 2 protein n=1 Tax=Terrimonas ginsenosidimutans TaxID=2908004 RepID=A0ABS9KL27_9BACT|nr:glycosyltransferase family 2 protein [Terrimonas ginsenosidimutans]
MDLSVIIVNYNVKYFLEQCLFSLREASKGLRVETIVVDNHSSDNTLAYLQPKFPAVRFIANAENRGFAQACNQGLHLASGKFILFLNPDTVLPEDCLHKSIAYLQNTPGAGALGIKMLDGSGNFLRESKRSFPSPMTSFFKLTGLARLFPRSKVFARYHLGNLDENKSHGVDVLAGAFMLIKKDVLDKIGSFDETFFMYGEDVDLSYRIQKAGFANHYFAGCSIIHFKGESTKRGSLNYVKMFYNAMSIFVRKHYGGKKAGIFSSLIQLAIWVRAALSAIATFIRRIGLPMIDALLMLVSFWVMKNVWNQYVRTDTQYETRILWMAFPGFTFVYLVAAYYAGLYDKWYKTSELIRSTLIATIVLLAGYSLLPEGLRFSRGIILFGAVLAFLLIAIFRKILTKTGVLSENDGETHANTLIIGNTEEYMHCVSLIKNAGTGQNIVGRLAISPEDTSAIGQWTDLNKIGRTLSLQEIIFCQGTLGFKDIVDFLPRVDKKARIMIHAAGSGSMVGSRSGKTPGEFVSTEGSFQLSSPYLRRLKRLLDVSFAIMALLSFPIQLIAVKNPFRFFTNCFLIIFGKRTWVGYFRSSPALPRLRTGVLASNGIPFSMIQSLPAESLHMIDYWYARDYELSTDIKLIWAGYRNLGN